MTTLHWLRRSHGLSFSELSMLTTIPVRRLAEFEYQGFPLSNEDRQRLAALFGIGAQMIEGGFVAQALDQPEPLPKQFQALAMLAATATLAWSLRVAPWKPIDSVEWIDRAIDTIAQLQPGAAHIDEADSAGIAPASSAASVVAAAVPTTSPVQARTAPQSHVESIANPLRTVHQISAGLSAELVLPSADLPQAAPIDRQLDPSQPPQTSPAAIAVPQPERSSAAPNRCPLVPQRGAVVLTQGYDVGTHHPADVWGAVDLAVRGGPTEGAPVVATHAGHVRVALNSWPGGNFVSISNDGWRTAYAHLKIVLVQDGEYVEEGRIIGVAGTTGQSTGPHLHYEIWRNGVNIDPSPMLFCDQ